MAVEKEHLPKGVGTRRAGRLWRELELIGVRLPNVAGGQQPATSGASRLIDAAAIAGSTAAADQAREQVFDILARGEALSVTLRAAGTEGDGGELHATACDVLSQALREAGVSPAQLEIVVDGDNISPQRAAEARRDTLGDGIVHVLTRGNAPHGRQGSRRCEEFWQQLWSHRADGTLRIAYASQVMTPCALLASEVADTVLPQTHVQVPAGSAWLQFGIDVGRLAQVRGRPCVRTLEHVLRTCVDLGELLHDEVRWPTAQMRADAWLNRRLAIAIDGLGDLVLRQAMDPAAFSTLEYLDRLLGRVKRVLWEQSRALAMQRSYAPAIGRTDPGHVLPFGARRDDWRRRWNHTVAVAAIRHRNLLMLSPWSVFPSNGPAEFRFADLLPVLRAADVCTLAGAPGLPHWNVLTFKAFHLRACAVLQQREAAHQIAEGY